MLIRISIKFNIIIKCFNNALLKLRNILLESRRSDLHKRMRGLHLEISFNKNKCGRTSPIIGFYECRRIANL